jgi:hypothetical protein
LFGKSLGKRAAAFHVSLDAKNQLLHGRVVVTRAHDLECLHQGDTRSEHRCELTAEYRDIGRRNFRPATERLLPLLADSRRYDALTAQVGAHGGLGARHAFTLDLIALAVGPFPDKGCRN